MHASGEILFSRPIAAGDTIVFSRGRRLRLGKAGKSYGKNQIGEREEGSQISHTFPEALPPPVRFLPFFHQTEGKGKSKCTFDLMS